MHRRHFISAAAGALLIPTGLTSAARNDDQVATPTSPQHHGRPRPIVLGDGIELIDYRIYPSEDVPRIIGEISSTRDDTVDAPVVSITFPDLDTAGLAYAPSVLPVMRPGESNMIFGILPDRINTDDQLATAEFGLCGSVSAGQFTDLNSPLTWVLSDLQENRRPQVQHLSGALTYTGAQRVNHPILQGLVRDPANRYVGTTSRIEFGAMPSGFSRPFSMWSAANIPNPANPYVFLADSLDYVTELFPSVVGMITQPGCPSLYDLD